MAAVLFFAIFFVGGSVFMWTGWKLLSAEDAGGAAKLVALLVLLLGLLCFALGVVFAGCTADGSIGFSTL